MTWLIGCLLGIIHTCLLPRKSTAPPIIQISCYPVLYKSMCIIPLNTQLALHVHHWLPYTVLALFGTSPLWVTYCWFMAVQGLCYTDRFKFVVTNPWG